MNQHPSVQFVATDEISTCEPFTFNRQILFNGVRVGMVISTIAGNILEVQLNEIRAAFNKKVVDVIPVKQEFEETPFPQDVIEQTWRRGASSQFMPYYKALFDDCEYPESPWSYSMDTIYTYCYFTLNGIPLPC